MDYNFALIDKRSGVNKKLNENTTDNHKNLLVRETLTKICELSLYSYGRMNSPNQPLLDKVA